jgi:hypothetical protein
MGNKRQGEDEVDEIEGEEAAPLPSREAMSLIDPSIGPRFPLEPSIPPPLTSPGTVDAGAAEPIDPPPSTGPVTESE